MVACHHKGPHIHTREAGDAEAEKMVDQKQRSEGSDGWEGTRARRCRQAPEAG